jgi:hypothetical protein
LDDFVEVEVVHEFEDEDDAGFFGEDGFGNNSLASQDGKLEVPGFDEVIEVGDFEDRLQESEEKVVVFELEESGEDFFEVGFVGNEVAGRSVQVGRNVLDVRAHDGDVFFDPVGEVEERLVNVLVFFGGFVFEMEENGQNLETEVDQIAFVLNGDLKVVEDVVFEFVLFRPVLFGHVKCDNSDCLKEKQDAFEVVILGFEEHLGDEGVKVIVVLDTSFT